MIVSYAQSKIKDVYTMLTNDIGVALSHQLLQYNAMIYYQYIEMLFSFMYLITFNIYESKTDLKKKLYQVNLNLMSFNRHYYYGISCFILMCSNIN